MGADAGGAVRCLKPILEGNSQAPAGSFSLSSMGRSTGVDQLEERVVRAAHAALATNRFVSPVDVLVGLGWLPQTRLDEWRQGRVDALETVVSVNLSKVSRSMAVFRRWAREQGLSPSETA